MTDSTVVSQKVNANLLNEQDLDALLAKIGSGKSKRIRHWVNSTLKRHMRSHRTTLVRVMDACEVDSPWVDIISAVLRCAGMLRGTTMDDLIQQSVHLVNVEDHPAWVGAALAAKQPVWYFTTRLPKTDGSKVDKESEIVSYWRHRLDYLTQLEDNTKAEIESKVIPEDPKKAAAAKAKIVMMRASLARPLSITIPVLEEQVKAWDKQLAKQKLLGSMYDGVEDVSKTSKVISKFKDHPVRLVKLVAEQAYKNEGKIMQHCVGRGSYFRKKESTIYSIRDPNEPKPLATFEVIDGSKLITRRGAAVNTRVWLAQIQAFADLAPPEWVTKLILDWCTEFKIDITAPVIGSNDEEEEEDEEGEEYDDEEDGDDDECDDECEDECEDEDDECDDGAAF